MCEYVRVKEREKEGGEAEREGEKAETISGEKAKE